MKEFQLPQKLTDLEKTDGDFFAVNDVIDLESYDSDGCASLLGSKMSF